jgi:hypothetical protein
MVPIHPVVLEKKFVFLRYYIEDGIENCHE